MGCESQARTAHAMAQAYQSDKHTREHSSLALTVVQGTKKIKSKEKTGKASWE